MNPEDRAHGLGLGLVARLDDGLLAALHVGIGAHPPELGAELLDPGGV
jgi:hypothetical protein